MLKFFKKYLNFKKTILLHVPDSFPSWHSRYGEDTGFADKIKAKNQSKIHAIKSNVEFWQQATIKFATGKYRIRIVHLEDTPEGKCYYLIQESEFLHIQKACFISEDNSLKVDNKRIDITEVAQNEGYTLEDFKEYLKQIDKRSFCIVHFTAFSY